MTESPNEKRADEQPIDTGGPPCGEAQSDGVPCEELDRDCEDCDEAEPEAREVYKARLKEADRD